MAHGDAWEGKWRGNWRMEWVASTLHTTSEHGVSSITTADAHTSAASSRMNWRPRRFKWTRPFRRKTKSGFFACTITFQLASTFTLCEPLISTYSCSVRSCEGEWPNNRSLRCTVLCVDTYVNPSSLSQLLVSLSLIFVRIFSTFIKLDPAIFIHTFGLNRLLSLTHLNSYIWGSFST